MTTIHPIDPSEVSLVIRLFGSFQLQRNGSALPRTRTHKEQWLLALLLLRRDEALDRRWLASLLWPDSKEAWALQNLRRSLTNLRDVLGEDAWRLTAPSPRRLRFDVTGAYIDLLAFDTQLARAATAHPLEERGLREAVELYRGPLLEECLEEWVLPERAVREHAYLSALEILATRAADPAETVNLLRQVVAIEPTRETAQRALMAALAASGDHAGMTLAYRNFRLYLSAELNAMPDAETVALYRRLRAEARTNTRSRPPLPTPASPAPRHLPYPTTALIGREAEIQEIIALLETTRLLTLTGTGGVGKTRLAIALAEEVADDYTDGVWFVDLAPLEDPAHIVQTIVQTLKLHAESDRPLLETLLDHLQNRSRMLILDNCEHLIGACASMAETLLSRCPHLRLLATSRQSLGIAGEKTWRTLPLSLPGLPTESGASVEALPVSAAEQLFLARARAVSPTFDLTAKNRCSVAEICHLLDGIPFAIELAAAWVCALPVAQLAARLRGLSDLLKNERHSTLPRQQTLRSTLDWSYRLLRPEEQTLLLRLSVFVGGWTLEAAEEVCADEAAAPDTVLMLLAGLVDKSLVVYTEQEGEARYRLLETTRAYAQEKLSVQAHQDIVRRHAHYFLRMTEEIEPDCDSPEQTSWLRCIEAEYTNLRAVLEWSQCKDQEERVASPARVELGLRLATAIYRFWELTSYLSEGFKFLENLLAAGQHAASSVQAGALHKAGILAGYQGDLKTAQSCFERALVLAKQAGNRVLEADNLCQLGMMAWDGGDYFQARTFLEASLAIYGQLDDKKGMSMALGNLGTVARRQGDFVEAQARYEEGLALCRQREDKRGIAYTLKSLGVLAALKEDWEAARTYHEESLLVSQQIGTRWAIAAALTNLGQVACEQGAHAHARHLLLESLKIRQEQQDQRGLIETSEMLARLLGAEGHPQHATALLGAAETLADAIHTSLQALCADYKRTVRMARAALSAEAFAAAWAQGRAMTIEQALSSVSLEG